MNRAFISTLLVAWSTAAVFKGIADSKNGFKFMGKFVFDTGKPAGTLQTDLEMPKGADPKKYENYEIWLYDDEVRRGDNNGSWPVVYDHMTRKNNLQPLSCTDARMHAKNLEPDGSIMKDYKVTFGSDGKFSRVANVSQSTRKRFWFAVVAHCDDKHHNGTVEDLQYTVTFINTQRKGIARQLGANEMGLQSLYVLAFFISTLFLGVHCYGVKQLSAKIEYVHPMVKLFLVVVVLFWLSMTCQMIHWVLFCLNGMGAPALIRFSDFADATSGSVFILILLLLAKGWTISGEELTNKILLLAVVALYFIASILVLIWKAYVEDPAATFTSVPVQVCYYILNGVWAGFGAWFIMLTLNSYRNEDNPVKKALYGNLGIVYSLWMLGLPLATLLSVVLSPWVKEKFVQSIVVPVSFLGYMVLSYLLWPSRAEEYFNISTPNVMEGGTIDSYEQL